MREAQLQHVFHELVRDFTVIQEVAIGVAPPGSKMDLIDRQGCMQPLGPSAVLHPSLIVPLIGIGNRDHRSSAGALLKVLRVGI